MSDRGLKPPIVNRDRKARVLRALGLRLMHSGAKDDVIAFLVASDLTGDARELLFRDWCAVVWVSVLRSDLHRVRSANQRETNRNLF